MVAFHPAGEAAGGGGGGGGGEQQPDEQEQDDDDDGTSSVASTALSSARSKGGGAPSAAERFAADHRQKGLRSISLLLEMEDQPGTSPAAFEAALNELRWHRYHAREWASGVRSVQVRLAED